MVKKISQILFFIFSILTVFIIVSTLLAQRPKTYLNNNAEYFQEDDFHYLSMVSIAYNNDNTTPYIKKEPLFQNSYSTNDDDLIEASLNLSFYALIEKKKSNFNNILAVIINEVTINDQFLEKDDYGLPIIDATFYFDKEIVLNAHPYSQTKETFIPFDDSTKKVLLINHKYFKNNGGFSEIKRIELSYRLNNGTHNQLLVLQNSTLDNKHYNDLFANTFDKDIKNVISENIALTTLYDVNTLKENEEFFYNSTLVANFKKLNYRFVPYLLLDFLLLSLFYYLLFYHKYIIMIIKAKRKKKKEDFLLLQEKYKKEKKEDERKWKKY